MLLVLVDDESGTLTGSSREVLTVAHAIAKEVDAPVHAAAFGNRTDLATACTGYGVDTVHLIEGEVAADYSPELWGAALAELIGHAGVTGVLAPANDRGNEILAHAAARTGQAFASNCSAVQADQQGGHWSLTRLRGGGMLLEDAELSGAVKFASLAPGAAEPAEATTSGAVSTESFTPELAGDIAHSTIVERTSRGSGVSLATAKVIVSGGRGVGSSEGFASLEELAELLGGAVGCSRVATNNGWRSHSDQVGQTGTKIAADLYIACGISGATQHWVGCMGAKTILAINTDPEAPLVTRADYAVLGDVHEVLPAVIERVKARKEVPGAA